MVRNRLVGIAIDGVDGVGKSSISCEINRKYHFPVFSADMIRKISDIPLPMRWWCDVPMAALLEVIQFHDCVLDRSLLSVLAYNYDPFIAGNDIRIFDELVNFMPWYKQKFLFVFNTFRDVNNIIGRKPNLDITALIGANKSFLNVYKHFNIQPLFVYAEDTIDLKVDLIMKEYFLVNEE